MHRERAQRECTALRHCHAATEPTVQRHGQLGVEDAVATATKRARRAKMVKVFMVECVWWVIGWMGEKVWVLVRGLGGEVGTDCSYREIEVRKCRGDDGAMRERSGLCCVG